MSVTVAAEVGSVGTPIKVTGLTKTFTDKTILHGLDLDVPAGQFLAIVGRSGCGKSTLLRLIAGLEKVDHGRIDLLPPTGSTLTTRVMFQEPRLLPWARVVANVEVGLSGSLLSSAQKRQTALAALASVGLQERGDEWPALLSGGQKQRVALARALVSHPTLLAFDEPLGALDALTRIEMQGLLERVWQREGFTALLVTHDVAEAVTLADRIVMIENGVIALDVRVDIPRPRRRGSVVVAELEEYILKRLLHTDDNLPGYEI